MRRVDLPYRLPERGASIRAAFLGQSTYFASCLMPGPAGGVTPFLVDFRSGEDPSAALAQLDAIDPHVVVCLRPESLPAGALHGVRAPVVGVLSEPLPRAGRENHPDLEYNLAQAARIDRGNVDRVILTDALGWEAAAPLMPLWRSMPLPVDDRLFHAPRPSQRPPQVIFIGYSTMHRETALIGLKHEFDLRHYAHALMGQELQETLAEADAAIALHGERWVETFEPGVLVHLAAGQLVFSETLEPPYGLEPGIDFVAVDGPDELDLRIHQLHGTPDMYDRVRIRGHHKARQFRAGAVWPRVIGDLFADLAAFGTERAPAG